MATEAEIKALERKKILDEIKRKRAIAAQSEGILGAAERGEYGDVGQGEPKGEFDDEINQDPGDEDVTQSAIVPSPNFSQENIMNAIKAGGEAGLYMTPIVGDVLSAKDSMRAMEAAMQAEKLIDKIKLGGLSFLAAAGAVPLVSSVYDASGPVVKKMIDDAINQAINPKLAMAGGDNLGINYLFNLLKRDDPRVQNPGTGSGMKGIGTGRGATEREIILFNQRQTANTKLQEIWDNAPKNEKGEAILPTDWFKSKEVKQQIYDSNPVLFTEWKNGVGSWNDFTKGFLAGKSKTGEDAVTASKLPVSGAKSAFDQATVDFQKALAKKLNVNSLNPQDQTYRYLNFIRLSESDDLLKNPNKFFKKHKFDDLENVDSTLYKGFEKFKVLDDKRIELSKDQELKILLEKIFPEAKNVKGGVKFQIAHTFESGQVRKARVSKTKKGKGGDPDEMYIDLNVINMGSQKKLEEQARKLEGIFSNENLSPELRREAMIGLEAINTKLTGMGAQGQTVTQIGDNIQSGFILGSKDVKFSTKISNMAEDRGIKLTDADYEILLKADNVIDPPRPFKDGGLVGISHLTRPL